MMADLFPIAVFPAGSLASSVITTVWVGVLVVAFFNLRLGWTFSGLVVPGYLVPLLITRPWSAAVVVVEGVVCYGLVLALSALPARAGVWCGFFGRDRFFALTVSSVAVRLSFDAWLLPLVGSYLESTLHLGFDYRNELHSFGLVIVALIANLLWKPGLVRGTRTLLVTVAVTYVLVRYGLMELTNFNVGALEYMYEEMATSLLASSKAYIILITAALLASHMNLQYGWDFNGILIPSLLALLWYEPTRILATLLEAGLVYAIAASISSSRWLRSSSVEGARKLLLFFTVAFVYKLLLGHLALAVRPDLKVSDLYGFGYLLSTLLALKAHEKEIPARVARATLQVSLVGAAAASLIGYALTLVSPRWTTTPAEVAAVSRSEPVGDRLLDVLRVEKLRLYERGASDAAYRRPEGWERRAFASGCTALLEHLRTRQVEDLEAARGHFAQVGYRVDDVGDRYLYLRETRAARRGWGFYILDRHNPQGLLVEVPAALSEWSTLEAGLTLFRELGGSALAVGGALRGFQGGAAAGALASRGRGPGEFHDRFGRQNVLRVRGYTWESARALAGVRRGEDEVEVPDVGTRLYVDAALPKSLDLVRLKGLIGSYGIEWKPSPSADRRWGVSGPGHAELFLERSDARALLVRSILGAEEADGGRGLERQSGFLAEWLLALKPGIAAEGSEAYQAPSLQQLLFFDTEVVTPLLRLLRAVPAGAPVATAEREELRAIAAAAGAVDYRLVELRDHESGSHYLALVEDEAAPRRRHWGSYVFRLGEAAPFVVQIPRPLREQNSFEYGMALFDHLGGRLLSIAGAHASANRDGGADAASPDNTASVFNLVFQATMRAAAAEPALVVQSRAFGTRPGGPHAETDVMVSTAGGVTRREALGPLATRLVETLERDDLVVRFVDGSAGSDGYEAAGVPQARYLWQAEGKDLVCVWVSPSLRAGYRAASDAGLEAAQFRALGIPSLEVDLAAHILRPGLEAPSAPPDPSLLALLEHYRSRRDVVALAALQSGWPRYGYERVVDRGSRQAFLVVRTSASELPAVARLARGPTSGMVLATTPADPGVVARFVRSRSAALAFEAPS